MAAAAPPTIPAPPSQGARKPRSALVSAAYTSLGWFLETVIEALVRIAGRRIRITDAPWLGCPLGDSVLIGTGIYERIAREENLELREAPDAGLIADFAALRGPSFAPEAVDPRVRHFYEHAAQYRS